MKKLLLSILWLLSAIPCRAQNSAPLSLEICHAKAKQSYPLTRQRELISRSTDYNIANLQKGYLPQFTLNAQATYQSDVTQIPVQLPGVTPMSKDQYKVYGELNQVIYDGGAIKQQKSYQRANDAVQQQQLDAELYKLKDRINQLFFGILLLDQQLKQNDLLADDIQLGLKKMQAAIDNGTALKSTGDVLRAELLRTTQRSIELRAARKAYTDMLSYFIAEPVGEDRKLVTPAPIVPAMENNRPELSTYIEQKKALDVQLRLLNTRKIPRLGLFLQGGYGRPTLNMLSNQFDTYYTGGIKLSWSPSVLYTEKNDRALIGISRSNIDLQRDLFIFNTNLAIQQQEADRQKFSGLLATDAEIIALRDKVKTASLAQLENGVINSSDYLREVNAADQAYQNRIVHEIQSLLAQYNEQTTTGNL